MLHSRFQQQAPERVEETAMNASSRGNTTSAGQKARPSARERAANLRREEQRKERRRQRLMSVLVVGGAAVIGGGILLVAILGQPGEKSAPSVQDLAAVSGRGAETAPPWPAPTNVAARAEAAGLPLGPMGTAEHYHAHLDVLVGGRPVPVPANIGVDPASGAMSALHTHSTDGVIHVESGRVGQPFTLGQLFTEWNVKLTPTQIGSLEAGGNKTLNVYVNGEKVTGDPSMIRLAEHQQIAVVFGPANQKVDIPDSYDFAEGQ